MIINAETLQDISICADLSVAAYLDAKNFEILNLSKPYFQDYDYHFVEDKKTDTQVHILIGEFIYISYRGTESGKDAITDLSISRNLKGIHNGFYDAYMSVKKKVNSILTEALTVLNRKVFLCGHSLGGALALIHVNELPVSAYLEKINYIKTQVITFGAPMVFNSEAAQFFMKPYYRIEYKLDPVPRLPSDKIGYVYPRGQLLWIDLFNSLRLNKPWWADKFSIYRKHHSSGNYAKFFKDIINQAGFNSGSYISIK